MLKLPSRSLGEIYTDLAIEAHERAGMQGFSHIPGVDVDEYSTDNCHVSRVSISSREGSKILGKVPGNYVTLDVADLKQKDRTMEEEIATIFAKELKALLRLEDDDEVLVVGLGNWQATPDALGPRVISNLLVTRHMRQYVPEDIRGGLRGLAAIAPGVLGITGIETSEIIQGVVEKTRPAAVICVDALAARDTQRLLRTIQIADTGIHPGSGVGNKRLGITSESLGVPVIAVGVPTVVHAATIAYDTINYLIEELQQQSRFYEILDELDLMDRQRLYNEVLQPKIGSLVVTPKEIDVYINEISRVIAGALNTALHHEVTYEDHFKYLM